MRPLQYVWSFLQDAWSDCRNHWRPLLVAGIVWRVISALLLPSFYALLIHLAIVGSGQNVLTDVDLLYFVTSLTGLLGLTLLSVAVVAVVFLEMGTFLTILSQPADKASFVIAIRHTLSEWVRLIRVASRIVIQTIFWLLPALVTAGLTYYFLLSKFDINYYLAERPPSFWIAAVIAVGIVSYTFVVVVKLATDWILALPITLFEKREPSEIRYLCKDRVASHHWEIQSALVIWLILTFLLSIALTSLVGSLIWVLGPLWPRSLTAVAIGVGLSLFLLVLVNIASNFLSTVAFVGLVNRLYEKLDGIKFDTLAKEQSAHSRSFWLTPPRILAGSAIAILGASLLGFAIINEVNVEDDVIVIGHRGSPKSAPGNTLASIRAAIEERTDWVEIDVQLSADDEVIVFHDGDLMKAAGSGLKIADATTAQLSEIDLGTNFDPKFAGEGIPTFAEVLAESKDKAGVVVELKIYDGKTTLEQRVVEIVEELDMVDQTMFMSLDRSSVERLRKLRPEWRIGQLLSVSVGNASRLDVDFLGVNASFATHNLIRSTHQAGRDVYVWTVDDPVKISSLVSRGVDGIITDLPAVAKAVLEERSQMPPLLRLLVDLADRFQIATPFDSKLASESTSEI